MGLVPITLKDIAWPQRRIVPVSRGPPFTIEILVRALGLISVVYGKSGTEYRDAVTKASEASRVVRWAWNLRKRTIVFIIWTTATMLLLSYAAIAIVEVYSKRSSLGCPFPVFVLAWFIVALLPGWVHTFLSRIRRKWDGRAENVASERENIALGEIGSSTTRLWQGRAYEMAGREDTESDGTASAVQGADEWWAVQLIWAIYYVAGTLIFSSIMAVTVIELFVWVMISVAATGLNHK